jgi:hypothetical protein
LLKQPKHDKIFDNLITNVGGPIKKEVKHHCLTVIDGSSSFLISFCLSLFAYSYRSNEFVCDYHFLNLHSLQEEETRNELHKTWGFSAREPKGKDL